MADHVEEKMTTLQEHVDALVADGVMPVQMHNQTWTDRAKCRGADVELFTSTNPDIINRAKEFCANCPVIINCLDHALASSTQDSSVLGGMSQRERTQLKQRIRERALALAKSKPIGPTKKSRRDCKAEIYETVRNLGGYQNRLQAEQMALATVALYGRYVRARESGLLPGAKGRPITDLDQFYTDARHYFSGPSDLHAHGSMSTFYHGNGHTPAKLKTLQSVVGDETLRDAIRETLSSPEIIAQFGKPPRLSK